ncbi:hypothetical protein K505DRAFT_333166 [Melanomma pulvis-pyrius CBS 109.77]|uniref:Ubiquitin-like domain-containing protein n=1 Tax=Melanomma pulvis-pyrius CBS 109.77 TaxID=1314802 RepID=A0A6A6XQC6_9PLEO|nr:hypothetical protein K505DRAFT_333166 [Melanomma pulvis-pyrius CBS 109.77]
MSPYSIPRRSKNGSNLERGSASCARLLNQDNICFEDVLGRLYPLPYQYFSVWEVTQSYLKNEFKGRPGESLVKEGRFHLLSAVSGWKIGHNQSEWTRLVLPGSHIDMSVILILAETSTACPRCHRCLDRTKAKESKLVCSNCALERYLCEAKSATSGSDHYLPSLQDLSLFKRVHASATVLGELQPESSFGSCGHWRCSQCSGEKWNREESAMEYMWFCCQCGLGCCDVKLSPCYKGY